MPDYHEEEHNGDVELVLAPQHLVNASWKMTTLSLLAVVVALIFLLGYWIVGVDAAHKDSEATQESMAQLSQEVNDAVQRSQESMVELRVDLNVDHKTLVCRDVATYLEQRAVSDTIVVFLVALQNLAADVPIDVDQLRESIQNLRKVQGERDSTINTCLNGSTSEVDELASNGNG